MFSFVYFISGKFYSNLFYYRYDPRKDSNKNKLTKETNSIIRQEVCNQPHVKPIEHEMVSYPPWVTCRGKY